MSALESYAGSCAGSCEHRGAGEHGFSLVELLIALAIVATMAGAFATVLAQNASARRIAAAKGLALLVAQSQLDAAVAGATAQGASGQSGTLFWRVEHAPYGPLDPLDRHPLEQVRVQVGTADRRDLVSLAAIRIVP